MALGETVMRIGEVVTELAAGVPGHAALDGAGSMVVEALAGGGIRVAVMLLVLTGLVMMMRGASAATRHAVWRLGFVVALLLPFVATATPWRLEVLPGRAAPTEASGEAPMIQAPVSSPVDDARPPAALEAGAALDADVESQATLQTEAGSFDLAAFSTAPARWATPALSTLLLVVWLVGALLLAIRLLIGHGAVRGIVRSGRRLTAAEWTSPLYEAADILDVEIDVDLVASERITMPFTAGIRRPAIVLPETAQAWDAERRRAVLMHELAHVRRRDLFSHHVARWVCALHWFNPLAWTGARRMRADSERAADDLVLGAGTRASDYAGHLLEIVSSAGHSPMPAPALPLAQRREFEGRMLAILEPGIRRSGPGRLQSLAVTALVLLMTLPLAAIGREDATVDAQAESARKSTERTVVSNPNQPNPLLNRNANENVEPAWPDAPPMPEPSVMADQAAHSGVKSVVPAIMETLTYGNVDVRQTAVSALGDTDDPRAVQALIRILRQDPAAEVRVAAAFALGEIEDAAAVPALGEALRTDASVEVRRKAAWALGQIEDAGAIDALAAALSDEDADVRQTSMWALGQIESPEALPALVAALSGGDIEARRTAAWALGQIEDARAVEGLVVSLGSEDVELREMAAWALGQIESSDAVAALGRMLGDPVVSVRAAVVHALAEIEDPASAPALAAALADESAEVRTRAAFALGELSLSVAPPALIQALRDPHPEVRTAAAHALGEMGDAAAIGALTAALADDDDDVRMAAIHALLDMDSDAGTGVLLELLEHEDPQVRKRAAEALGHD